MITSSPGLTSDHMTSDRPPLVPLVTNTLRSAWPNSLVDLRLQLVAQRGHALRHRVGVLARAMASMRGVFDRLGHVEIGLADREVDRVLHLRGQVEDLADAAGIKSLRSFGKQAHGGKHQCERG